MFRTSYSGSSSGGVEFEDVHTELMQYVQYAYYRYYEMEDRYGLTKRHLNYGLFALVFLFSFSWTSVVSTRIHSTIILFA